MSVLRLKSEAFRRERERSWRALEALVESAERHGVRSLRGADLLRLPMLYRGALSSLSVARAISLDKNLLDYLEGLGQRAYFVVYGVRRPLSDSAADFFVRRFPLSVRRLGPALGVAAAVMLAGFLAGFVLTKHEPDRFYAFVDEALAQGRDPTASRETLRKGLYERHADSGDLGLFSSFLFTHNARVGILCFALGFVFGLPTIYLLFQTGIMLGAFGALYSLRGLTADWYGWVLPHGVTEILAVLLCGAAGLTLGAGVAFPGPRSRLARLAESGRAGGVVVVGAVGMFLVAGLLEGAFRQLVTDVSVRYAVAALTAAFWAWYLLGVARSREALVTRAAVTSSLAAAQDARTLPVRTPEGVVLPFTLASRGERAGAFLVDFFLVFLAMLLLGFLAALAIAGAGGRGGWLLAFVLLTLFLLQNLYFIWFEAKGGATPGKRRFGLRVMDAEGGVLTIDAVVARNLLRMLEVWLPLTVLFVPQAIGSTGPGWIRVASALWLVVVAGLPFFNTRRLRAGDLVAGTVVVLAPKPVLLPDLAGEGSRKATPTAPAARFTDAQLDVYGIYELQVLEDVLRIGGSGVNRRAAVEAVARKIAEKIQVARPTPKETEAFLRDYYTAVRARLEARMLLGKRKADKNS